MQKIPDNFHPIIITDKQTVVDNAVAITFAVPAHFAPKPGQYLTLATTLQGATVMRAYSICHSRVEGDRALLTIGVRVVEGGRFSTWLAEHAAVGMTMASLAPEGAFQRAEGVHNAVFVAGGSGITPILAMLRAHLAEGEKATLMYANRTPKTAMFLPEITALLNAHPEQLTVQHFYSVGDSAQQATRLNSAAVLAAYHAYDAATGVATNAPTQLYICGPRPLRDGIVANLTAQGVPSDAIHSEDFGLIPQTGTTTAPSGNTMDASDAPCITYHVSGATHTVDYDGGETILAAGLNAGLALPYGCQAGVCGACRCTLVSGLVDMAAHYALSEEDIANNAILACQAVAAGSAEVTFDR